MNIIINGQILLAVAKSASLTRSTILLQNNVIIFASLEKSTTLILIFAAVLSQVAQLDWFLTPIKCFVSVLKDSAISITHSWTNASSSAHLPSSTTT